MKYEVLNHSCIRLEGSKTIYFDPYEIKNEPHDADFVFVTHNHTTHFSPEDIFRVSKPIKLTPDDGFAPDNTIIVTPESVVMLNAVQNIVLQPGDAVFAFGIEIEAVPAYNIEKPHHPRENNWLGYIVSLDGVRYYIAGDTDNTPEARAVKCDVAFLPIGGESTCNIAEAAALSKAISPSIEAVPVFANKTDNSLNACRTFYAFLNEQHER